MIFRFLAALGIGGEWAVGASLLSETWPRRWRPWIAAVLQTGVNLGILRRRAWPVCADGRACRRRYVFLVGDRCRRCSCSGSAAHVPEPEEWRAARDRAGAQRPRRARAVPRRRAADHPADDRSSAPSRCRPGGPSCSGTCSTCATCPSSPAGSAPTARRLVSDRVLPRDRRLDRRQLRGRRARAVDRLPPRDRRRCASASSSRCSVPSACRAGTWRSPASGCRSVGFFSGVFGLFTMYLPPLFPTLLRTTGAGFCYNIGRIAAAVGTVVLRPVRAGGRLPPRPALRRPAAAARGRVRAVRARPRARLAGRRRARAAASRA